MHVVAILLIILGVAFVITMGSAMVADLFEGRRKARQKNPRSPQRNPIKKSQTNTVTPSNISPLESTRHEQRSNETPTKKCVSETAQIFTIHKAQTE